jgi:hypothetical protein
MIILRYLFITTIYKKFILFFGWFYNLVHIKKILNDATSKINIDLKNNLKERLLMKKILLPH